MDEGASMNTFLRRNHVLRRTNRAEVSNFPYLCSVFRTRVRCLSWFYNSKIINTSQFIGSPKRQGYVHVLQPTDRAELIYSHLCLISRVWEECLSWFCFKKAINSSPFAEILKVKSISLFFFVFACKFKENKLYLQKYLIIKIDHYEPDINSHKAACIVAPFAFCNRDFNFDEPNLLRSNNKCSDP